MPLRAKISGKIALRANISGKNRASRELVNAPFTARALQIILHLERTRTRTRTTDGGPMISIVPLQNVLDIYGKNNRLTG